MACAVGMALAAKMDKKDYKVFCVVGDGEAQEGEIWEAANTAHKYKLDNFIVFVDVNNLQIDGTTDEVMPNGDLGEKFKVHPYPAKEAAAYSAEPTILPQKLLFSDFPRTWQEKYRSTVLPRTVYARV